VPSLSLDLVPGVSALPAEEWNALVDVNDPFLEHGFLAALERSGSVGGTSGWQPRIVVARAGGALVGAVPLYLKHHSYGEFVFDFGWAAASERARLRYYPKLVAAVPFTPVTGSRLLVRPDLPRPDVVELLLEGVRAVADDTGASSIHVLFCSEGEQAELAAAGFAPRLGMQFHWRNRAPRPYADFEDFLSAFRSRNRKQVRRERAVAAGHGLRLATLTGPELGERDWEALERFYASNIDKHEGSRYLTPAFFQMLRGPLSAAVVATLAYRDDRPVAGTLNFERGRHLYGRYWGCLEEREMLHFELCYYSLIERAVSRGHDRFEAGAQGEHKLKRGLDPALTWSAHFIRHDGLRAAVERSLAGEAIAMRAQIAEYKALSPYARTSASETGDGGAERDVGGGESSEGGDQGG
jgi:predicted N-acyltransferase